jgi:hypothetical protein
MERQRHQGRRNSPRKITKKGILRGYDKIKMETNHEKLEQKL